jgi:4-amino-4-deoxy-L-arabinose transferase-like glycosyltransferase
VRRRGGAAEPWVGLTPVAIVAYFAATGAMRAATPGALNLDEAEMMVAAQSLDPGYGPQPPLYVWLQIGANALLGEGKLALAAVKHALLAATALGLWAAARLAGAAPRVAAVAALSLAFLPQFLWESQRALTHTVLAAALLSWGAAALVGAAAREGWRWALALGALAGLAALAKLNAVFLAAGLLAAAFLAPGPPRSRAAAAAAVALAVVAPYGLWMAGNLDLVTARVDKFGVGRASGVGATAAGLAAFLLALASSLALLAASHGWLIWRRPAPGAASAASAATEVAAAARLLAVATAVGLGAALVATLAAGATEVKERWLHPVLVAAPLVAALAAAGRLGPRAARDAARAALALALVAAVALQVNLRIGGLEPSDTTRPFAAFAAQAAAGGRRVLAQNTLIGGNLRLVAPELVALTPEMPRLGVPMEAPDQMIWEARRGDTPPEALMALHRARFGREPAILSVERLAAPWPWPHQGEYALMRARLR